MIVGNLKVTEEEILEAEKQKEIMKKAKLLSSEEYDKKMKQLKEQLEKQYGEE